MEGYVTADWSDDVLTVHERDLYAAMRRGNYSVQVWDFITRSLLDIEYQRINASKYDWSDDVWYVHEKNLKRVMRQSYSIQVWDFDTRSLWGIERQRIIASRAKFNDGANSIKHFDAKLKDTYDNFTFTDGLWDIVEHITEPYLKYDPLKYMVLGHAYLHVNGVDRKIELYRPDIGLPVTIFVDGHKYGIPLYFDGAIRVYVGGRILGIRLK